MKFKELIKLDIFFSAVFVFVLLFFFPIFFNFAIFDPFKVALQDFNITDTYFSKIWSDEATAKETDIVIINLSEKTPFGIQELDGFSVAQIIDAVNRTEPKVIGVDYVLKYDSISAGEKYNPMFSQFIKTITSNTKNLILSGEFIEFDKQKNTYNILDSPDTNLYVYSQIGFNNLILGKSQQTTTVRSFQPNYNYKGKNYKLFDVLVAEKYNPDAVTRFLSRNNETETINFIGNDNKFFIINGSQILEGNFDPEMLKDKIILMGAFDTTAFYDKFDKMYFTPLNRKTAGKTFPDMYSTIIHANIVSMLLTDKYFNKLADWISIAAAFFICYFNMLVFYYISNYHKKWYELSAMLIFLVESVGTIYVTVLAFSEKNLEMDLTLTIMAAAISVLAFEIYYETIKPLVVAIINKVFKKDFAIE